MRRALPTPTLVLLLALPSQANPPPVASGDVTTGSAVIWSRGERASRMIVETDLDPAFPKPTRHAEVATDAARDFTAKATLAGLPAGTRIHYRVRFAGDRSTGEAATGSFTTAPRESRDLRFAWSGDTAGQGWGIDPARGGMRTYESMRRFKPDFFIHCGDMIYADNPIAPEVELDDGSVWKNLVTPEKSKVAETLDEFRGAYRYNWLDTHFRRFHAEVPVVVQWDDHEVTNNWYPGESLDADPRYREKSVATLAGRARQAFFEYHPIAARPEHPGRIYRRISYGPDLDIFLLDLRSYRGDNSPNDQPEETPETSILGQAQVDWLAAGLAESRAKWKIIASDMPIGLVIRDEAHHEGIANGDGPPRGRELELARLFSRLKEAKVRNTVWLTADVHYAAAHRYDPERAVFKDFLPFWEFVSGPLHAGNFGPNPVDNTFGLDVKFQTASKDLKVNRPPSEGYQYFGAVELDAETGKLTVSQRDREGKVVHSVTLDPEA
jgi:alkaline phosphatase D